MRAPCGARGEPQHTYRAAAASRLAATTRNVTLLRMALVDRGPRGMRSEVARRLATGVLASAAAMLTVLVRLPIREARLNVAFARATHGSIVATIAWLSIEMAYIVLDEDRVSDRGRCCTNAYVGAEGLWTVTRRGQPPRDVAPSATVPGDSRLTTALEQPRAIRASDPTGAVVHTAAQALPPPTEAFGLCFGRRAPAVGVLDTASGLRRACVVAELEEEREVEVELRRRVGNGENGLRRGRRARLRRRARGSWTRS